MQNNIQQQVRTMQKKLHDIEDPISVKTKVEALPILSGSHLLVSYFSFTE